MSSNRRSAFKNDRTPARLVVRVGAVVRRAGTAVDILGQLCDDLDHCAEMTFIKSQEIKLPMANTGDIMRDAMADALARFKLPPPRAIYGLQVSTEK
jgi:hypothetical protein